MIEKLDETNVFLYAAKHYDNPQCFDTLEFYEDLKRFQYLKRLFNKYKESGEFRERLVLNHIIILYNVFATVACTRLLFFKLKEHHDILKPILEYLNFMPETINGIGIENKNYKATEIQGDNRIYNILKRI